MCKVNNCEKCPYFKFYSPRWVICELSCYYCDLGFDVDEGCKHNRLVRWILFKLQQRKDIKYDKYMSKALRQEDKR